MNETREAAVAQRTQELEESERKYRTIVEHSKEIFFTHDTAHTLTYVSPQAEQVLGYTQAEMRRKWTEFVTDNPLNEAGMELTERAIRTGIRQPPYVLEVRRKDGQIRLVEIDESPVKDTNGKVIGISGALRDITERNRTEQALLLRDRAVNAAAEGISITDPNQPNHPAVFVNRGFENLTGYSAEEVLGRNMRFLQGPATDPKAVDQLRQAIAQGRPTTVELQNYRKDGSTFWNRIAITPVRDESGAVTHFIGIHADMTEQKRAEERLRQRDAELAHMGRLATMGEMATGIAHDLNQPLYAITNYVAALNAHVRGLGLESAELVEIVDKITAQVERAAEMIKRLRSTVKRCEPCRSSTNLNDLIRDVLKLLEYEFRQEGVTVNLDLQENLPMVLVDPSQIQQIFWNLIRNALDAVRDIASSGKELTVTTSVADSGMVEVSVSDTGKGMSDEVRHQVFDAFFTTKAEGLGMGLAISRGIIEAHGGRIWAGPHSPQGSVFCFAVPSEPQGPNHED